MPPEKKNSISNIFVLKKSIPMLKKKGSYAIIFHIGSGAPALAAIGSDAALWRSGGIFMRTKRSRIV
jgi:hypothetical protein